MPQLSTGGSDLDLDGLDARADAVAAQFSDDDSEYTQGSGESSSDTDEEDRAVAAAAAVPRKRAKFGQPKTRPPVDRNLEEDDAVLKAASWRDLEDSRKFLENDHRERFNVLISRWEGVEDGDDVDLNTGRVVQSKGHLDALAPQKNLAFFDESEDELESEDDEEAEPDRKGDFSGGIDPLYIVCQKTSPLLDMLVSSLRA